MRIGKRRVVPLGGQSKTYPHVGHCLLVSILLRCSSRAWETSAPPPCGGRLCKERSSPSSLPWMLTCIKHRRHAMYAPASQTHPAIVEASFVSCTYDEVPRFVIMIYLSAGVSTHVATWWHCTHSPTWNNSSG